MNITDNKYVLFLTACINPGQMPNTTLTDSVVRRNQYERALQWYLDNTIFKVVFVENSGIDISDKFQLYILEKRLEIITFNGNSIFDRTRGKGYGEALIIKYALNVSKILTKDSITIKISGRIIVKNINSLVRNSQNKNNLYMNTLIVENKCFASSKVVICPTVFWSGYFLPRIENINEKNKFYFEHCLYEAGKQWCNENKGKQKEFFLPIFFEGISGTSGKQLHNSKFPYLTAFCKYILRSIGIRKVKFYK